MSGTIVGVLGPVFADSAADNVIATLRGRGVATIALGSGRLPANARISRTLADLVERLPNVLEAAQRRIVRTCVHRDVSIVIALESSLLPRTVQRLRQSGCVVILWYCDAIVNLDRQMMFLGAYDMLFLKEPRLVDRVRSLLGDRVEYLPEACNPMWHRPGEVNSKREVVVMAGNIYPFRLRLLERLVAERIPIEIYGPPVARWMDRRAVGPLLAGRYLARGEKAAVFRAACAVLNTLHPSEVDGINCRVFEAAGCGAALVSESRPALEQCFSVNYGREPGGEVVGFGDFDGLMDRLRWLLTNPDEGRALGDRAAKRAHADHTYDRRLAAMFVTLGMDVW